MTEYRAISLNKLTGFLQPERFQMRNVYKEGMNNVTQDQAINTRDYQNVVIWTTENDGMGDIIYKDLGPICLNYVINSNILNI